MNVAKFLDNVYSFKLVLMFYFLIVANENNSVHTARENCEEKGALNTEYHKKR